MKENTGNITIYQDKHGSKLEVQLDNDTVWLSQAQMAELFDKNRDTISEHIGNIFKESELIKDSVTRKSRATAKDGKTYHITFYNLDVIISVGYRVKSLRGTQFRIWATKTLKDHLVKGYTINEMRFAENRERLTNLEYSIDLIKKAIDSKALILDEAQGLLNIITEYTRSWIILNKFDTNELKNNNLTHLKEQLNYEEGVEAIRNFRKELNTGDIFGNEINKGLDRILGAVNQTFNNEELYPSIEEKAAHLLYLIIKDHPFSDGNKRIGSLLFLMFLDKNDYLNKADARRKINDNALVAIALLVAISAPKDKEIMITLIVNLIKE